MPYQRQRCWNRSGIAWNVYLHDDLDHPRLPAYKLFYFLNTFFLTDAEVEAIQRRLRGSGATVIWTYAPGIQSPAGLDLERATRLTGFRLRAADIEAMPEVSIINTQHPYVAGTRAPPVPQADPYAGTPVPVTFGTGPLGGDEHGRVIGPIIYVDDPDATVIGELTCLRQPGFCAKAMDGWTSVYNAAPMLNQHLLRNIAAAAGVHVWSWGDDVVLPGRSFVMIHASHAGEKCLCLPEPTDVHECYDDVAVGSGLTEVRRTMAQHATAIYFLGRGERLGVGRGR